MINKNLFLSLVKGSQFIVNFTKVGETEPVTRNYSATDVPNWICATYNSYVNVYDHEKDDYRTLNLNGIKRLVLNGKAYSYQDLCNLNENELIFNQSILHLDRKSVENDSGNVYFIGVPQKRDHLIKIGRKININLESWFYQCISDEVKVVSLSDSNGNILGVIGVFSDGSTISISEEGNPMKDKKLENKVAGHISQS